MIHKIVIFDISAVEQRTENPCVGSSNLPQINMNIEVIIKLIQIHFCIETFLILAFIIKQGWSEKNTRDYVFNGRASALKAIKLLLLSLFFHIPEFRDLIWLEKLLRIFFYCERFLAFLFVDTLLTIGFFINNEMVSVLEDVILFVLFLLNCILEELWLRGLSLFEKLIATVFSDDRFIKSIVFYTLITIVFFFSLSPTEEKKLIFIVKALISGLKDTEIVILILKALIIFLTMDLLVSTTESLNDKGSPKEKKRKDAVNEMKSALEDIRLLVLSLLFPEDILKFYDLTWLEKLLKIFYCCKRIVSACYIFVKNIP